MRVRWSPQAVQFWDGRQSARARRLHLEAANLSPRTVRAYSDDGTILVAFLADKGMPPGRHRPQAGLKRSSPQSLCALRRRPPQPATSRYSSFQVG